MRNLFMLLTVAILVLAGNFALLAEEVSPAPTVAANPTEEGVKIEEVCTPREVKVLFSFEKNLEGWEIPDWCFEKDDYVGQKISSSNKASSDGNASLELVANFPGGVWTAVYTEIMQYLDLSGGKAVAVDLFLPADAPNGLKAKVILTYGDDWRWTEMTRSIKLEPGKWVTIEASLTDDSNDWRGVAVDDEFRSDIRKLGVRVESNMRPVYNGPIYIDKVRIVK